MVDNEILKFKLKNKLDKLGLSDELKERLVAELNRLSDLLIDIYLDNKNV
jgi:hypothetical protein